LHRGGLHAPNADPGDGLTYKTIHNDDIQKQRQITRIPCGPCGVVHDYVSFYFGYLSPMLFQLKTGRVSGYNKGQEPLIYLVSAAQIVADAGIGFVFSDGHGIAAFTDWYDDLQNLGRVDWDVIYQKYWRDTNEDMDRQRRKQAEFLVYRFCDWQLINEIAVCNMSVKRRVEDILDQFSSGMHRNVVIRKNWYY
jgi:hypothetical protein